MTFIWVRKFVSQLSYAQKKNKKGYIAASLDAKCQHPCKVSPKIIADESSQSVPTLDNSRIIVVTTHDMTILMASRHGSSKTI